MIALKDRAIASGQPSPIIEALDTCIFYETKVFMRASLPLHRQTAKFLRFKAATLDSKVWLSEAKTSKRNRSSQHFVVTEESIRKCEAFLA